MSNLQTTDYQKMSQITLLARYYQSEQNSTQLDSPATSYLGKLLYQ